MNHQARDYTEKRDFIRMSIKTPITLSQAGCILQGVCQDLSSTGMQVVAAGSFDLGDKIDVRIPSEHAELKGLEAMTEVVRVERQADGCQRLGLSIQSLR
ncbi:PilZ domain-containing protein [Pseudomonas sp. YJ42]|uniref:PilZ domain-containing protein n=1 Tax=Pseudomonas sp. YJ42 TaxID=3392115 RepID=UPI0039A247AC